MVAVVTGAGLGLSNTSKELAGQAGELGQSAFGRANERVTVNAATGNLVIQNRDEFLVGIGEDVSVARTYNSLGAWDGACDGDVRPTHVLPRGPKLSIVPRPKAPQSELRIGQVSVGPC